MKCIVYWFGSKNVIILVLHTDKFISGTGLSFKTVSCLLFLSEQCPNGTGVFCPVSALYHISSLVWLHIRYLSSSLLHSQLGLQWIAVACLRGWRLVGYHCRPSLPVCSAADSYEVIFHVVMTVKCLISICTVSWLSWISTDCITASVCLVRV